MENINWDAYTRNTSYDDVLNGLGFARNIMPTMYSKCKKFIYLHSDGIGYGVNEIAKLKYLLEDKKETLKSLVEEFKQSPSLSVIEKLYMYKVDYTVLCKIISDASDGEIEYHPETIFYEMQQE